MHRELHASLSHLAEAADDLEVAEALLPVLERLTNGERLPPRAFGLYFDLAGALMSGDAARGIARARDLMAVEGRGPRHVVAKGSAAAEPLARTLSLRMGEAFDDYATVSDEVARAFGPRLDAGLALLAAGVPELSAELDHILHQVMLVTEPEGAGYEFHGSSHYQFWGLLMINPRHHPTRMAMAEVLAHESAHSFLFGLTIEEPLVRNPDEELFSSPLRDDPRPMDGIYHATFVSARMAFAMERLANLPSLSVAEQDEARVAARRDRENFAAGYAVYAEHGRPSATGAAIMDSARAYMDTP